MSPLRRFRVTVALSVLLAGLFGCKAPSGLPEDPLFYGRKPVESKIEVKPPEHVAYSDPAPPPLPGEAPNERGLAGTPPTPQGMPTTTPNQ